MAAPFEAVAAFASGLSLVVLGAVFLLFRHAGTAERFFGAFAALWGLQASLANLGRVLADPAVHQTAFLASFALLPPATLFLVHAATRDLTGRAWGGVRAGAALLVTAATAVLAVAPGAVLQPGPDFASSLGPAAVPLFLAPFFLGFDLALVAFFRRLRGGEDERRAQQARGLFLAVAVVVSYMSMRQALVYAAPPPGIPALTGVDAAVLASLFLGGVALTLGLAGLLLARPRDARDIALVAALTVPAAWALGEAALAAGGPPADSIGLWRLVALAGLVLHHHHVATLEAAKSRENTRELERLREIDAMRRRFVNTAAHELRTPLTPARLQLDLLRAGAAELPPHHRRNVEVLGRSIERFSVLVEEMVASAQAQGEGFAVAPQRIDLAQVVRATAEEYAAPARQAGLRMEVRAPEALPLRGDPARLQQVMANLVDNAIRFTPPGGRITIEMARVAGPPEAAEVRVRDTGLGFPPAEGARLFAPFIQLHEHPAQGRPGSGLGLSICRGLVEAHGGRIAARSDGPHRGATFTLTLPLAGPPTPRAPGGNGGRARVNLPPAA